MPERTSSTTSAACAPIPRCPASAPPPAAAWWSCTCGANRGPCSSRPITTTWWPRCAGFFMNACKSLTAAGIDAAALCFDPGIGFGKTLDHNLALLRALAGLAPENRPLLLGVSRKSFIGKLLENDELQPARLADRSPHRENPGTGRDAPSGSRCPAQRAGLADGRGDPRQYGGDGRQSLMAESGLTCILATGRSRHADTGSPHSAASGRAMRAENRSSSWWRISGSSTFPPSAVVM